MPDSTTYECRTGGTCSTTSSRPTNGHRPSRRTAPTPPGGGSPSRSQLERGTRGPAHSCQRDPSASTANTTSGGRELATSEVALLGDDAIHSVTNPQRSYAAAIHVYGGDYFATPRSEWDPDTLTERPFDVEHARRVLTEADEQARTRES